MSIKKDVEQIEKKIHWAIYLLGIGVAVAFSAMVYAHNTFVTKEIFSIVLKKLERIETKLDQLGGFN